MSDRHEAETRLMDALADLWGHGHSEEPFIDAVERNLFYATGKPAWNVRRRVLQAVPDPEVDSE